MSKKERMLKKEEDRRAKQAQEKETTLAGNLLKAELNDFKHKQTVRKRRKSTTYKVFDLEGIKKENSRQK